MSGDIQPRKRKDKRRKKEGSSIGAAHEPVSFQKFKRSESDDVKVFDVPDQGEKIHVQNEHGVGGNICVKIIFFCLFGLLVGAVGLIYLKSLGSTDVDLPTVEESRFAEYFTGWLDDGHDDHEHETPESSLDHDHDDHDEHSEHDDEEEHDHEDHEEDEEHEHEEEDQNSEQDSIYKLFGLQEEDTDEVEESEMKETKMPESESGINENVDDDDDDDVDGDNDDQEDEEEEEDERSEMEDEEEEEEEKEKSEVEEEEEEEESGVEDNENEDDEEEEESDVENNENEDDEDEDDNESGIDLTEKVGEEDEEEDEDLSQVDEEDESKYKGSHLSKDDESSETKQSGEEDDIKSDDDDDDDDEGVEQDGDENEENEEYEETDEVEKEEEGEDSKETGKPKIKTDSDDLGFEEIDVSEEDLEEDQHKVKPKGDSEDDTEEKMEKSSTEEEEEEQDADEADTGGVALRLGVGIALIIVAHLVLVKKWRSMSNATVDENTTTGVESTVEKKEVENLHSSFEPVISRRQTLVPEDVCLNGEGEEEEEEMEEEEDEEEAEEEEEEEEEEEDEEQEEEKKEDDFGNENYIQPEKPYVEEEIKSVKKDNWEIFEKPSWNIRRNQFEDEDDEDAENEELGGEEEEEEVEDEEDDVEEIEEEQEEEEEEAEEDEEEDDVDVEDDNDFVKHKFPQTVPEHREEEEEEEVIKETAPIPPPRTKPGRGAQEFQEFIDRFEEFNEIEDPVQDSPKVEEPNNNSGPEEQKTPESKVGNEDEWAFRQEFDIAEEQFENNPKAAVEAYEKIISKKPDLIRALIGHARALDHWAEKEKSNAHLKKAINSYRNILLNQGHRLDEETYVKLAERCIERMRFAGALVSAIEIHKALILKYPNTPKYRNMLAVTYLMLNKIPQARVLLNETLSLWPGNGFALVHYGFILKTNDNNMEEGAKKLMAGIQTREEGVIDGMFFFHLGDALNRLGRAKEAMEWYELGVKEGLFLSKYQRSLYNVNRLKGQPWWTKKETTYQDFFKKLEDNWREIRREGLELLNSKGVNLFKEEAENLKDTGDWKQLDLYFRGRKQVNCNKAPVTCSLVSSFKPASSCTRGQIKFSVMLPNTHVWPHCGPTNCRLRSHLGLVVPKGTFIRVAEETRSWEEGKFIIFDDSFEHEVWHNGTGPRLVLIVDVWHPELTNQERRYLSPI